MQQQLKLAGIMMERVIYLVTSDFSAVNYSTLKIVVVKNILSELCNSWKNINYLFSLRVTLYLQTHFFFDHLYWISIWWHFRMMLKLGHPSDSERQVVLVLRR